jgi:outer membrane protein assembly factor BamB
MRILLILAACGGFSWRIQTAANEVDKGGVEALATDGEIVYALGEKLSAYKNGTLLWSAQASGRQLAAGEGLAVVSGNGRVAAYKDGAQLWEQAFAQTSPAVIGGGKVVFVSNDALVALDALTGHILWKQAIALVRDLPFSRVAPALAAGRVCSGLGWEFNAVGLDKGDKGAHDSAGAIAAPLAAAGATCYFAESRTAGVAGGENAVVAVDEKVRWRTEIGGEGGIGSFLAEGGLVFAATNDRVFALDGASGAVRWTAKGAPVAFRRTHAVQSSAFAFGGLVAGDGAVLTAGDGKLFLQATRDGRDMVTALDERTGAYLGSLERGPVRALAVAGHTLWVATPSGLLSVATSSFSM